MPLDWAEVKKRYEGGTRIPTVAGGRSLEIVDVDDDAIYIRNPLWSDTLRREHLEKAVDLIEQGKLTRHAGLFAEEYRTLVADVRGSSVAHILKNFGFLE